jgi:hypothetical protein
LQPNALKENQCKNWLLAVVGKINEARKVCEVNSACIQRRFSFAEKQIIACIENSSGIGGLILRTLTFLLVSVIGDSETKG